MKKNQLVILFVSAALLLCADMHLNSAVVISQVSFGSDNSPKDEYVELYNNSRDEIIDISLWKIQMRSTRSMPWRTIAVIPEETFLPPRSYYLIGSKEYDPQGTPPDLKSSFGVGGLPTEGSIRLTDFYGSVQDLVGYGASAPEFETRPIVRIIGEVIIRLNPDIDTDNNQKDFRAQSTRQARNLSGQQAEALPMKAAVKKAQQVEESREVIADEKYNRSDALLSEARSEFRKGRWLTALEKTKLAEQFTPESTEVRYFKERMVKEVKARLENQSLVGQDEYYGRAFLYYSAEDYINMSNSLRKILVFNPRHAEAREFYEKIKPFVSARTSPGTTSETSSKSSPAKDGEVTIILDSSPSVPKKPSAASRQEPVAKKEQPSSSGGFSSDKADELYDRGLREFAEGRLSEAIRYWEQTLRIDPNHTRAQKALARAKKRIQSGE